MAITRLKRIAVHETMYQQLKSLGSAGDSFNDVLVRILASVQEGGRNKNCKGMILRLG